MPFQVRGISISYLAPARVPVQATFPQPVNGTAVAVDRIASSRLRAAGSEPHAVTSTTIAAAPAAARHTRPITGAVLQNRR